MAHHDVKQDKKHFTQLLNEEITATNRYNDRGYAIGDTITFHEGELDSTAEKGFRYTGETKSAVITGMDDYGCQSGFVVLSLGRIGIYIAH